jgi:amino acid efflux transporter
VTISVTASTPEADAMADEGRPVVPIASPVRATIGLGQAVALYLGAILGAGVLILPGVTASEAGPAAILSWMLIAILGLPLALTFARLAKRSPDAGGVAAFARAAFGDAAGAVSGWWFFIAGSIGQAIVPLTGAYYATAALGWGRLGTFAIAAAILAVASALNVVGLHVGARVQLALASAVGAVLVVAIATAIPHASTANLHPFFPNGTGAVMTAAIPLFYAFAGWEVITHLSAEFRNPNRDLVLGTLLTVGIVAFLYVGVCFAVVATHAYGDDSANRVAVTSLLTPLLGTWAAKATAVIAAVIALGTTNAYIGGTSRLGYSLGRDNVMPPWIGRLAAGGVPVRSVLTVSLIAGGSLAALGASGGNAEDILFIPAALVVATYLMSMAAGAKLLSSGARLTALIALLPCILVLFYLGTRILVPALVGIAALGQWKRRSTMTGNGN